MATATLDNVFPLANAQVRRRAVKPESVGVINDCRDIALKRIVSLLSETLDTIEDELFEMAEKSSDRDSQNLYLDARAQAREKRVDIEAAFKKQFLSFFEKKVAGVSQSEHAQGNQASSFESLSLVEDDELEQHLAMNDIARRLNNKCNSELGALSQRMGFLLSEPKLGDDANPIAPDTIVRALQAACNQMTSGSQTKLTVMRLVEQHMAAEILNVYRDINTHLVSRNVMPQLRTGFRKTPANDARKASTDAATGAGTSGANRAVATNAALATSSGDLFATLQQLLSGGSIIEPGHGGARTGASAGMTSSAQAGSRDAGASFTSSGLVSALTQIQQQLMPASTTLLAMRNMQNFVPGETSPAALNVLHEIKAQGMTSTSNQVDTMTIDIVAMLFDYVFEDKAVPDTIKALIARLQIPVLKVAIIDRSFFSMKSHPARRLLDVLADASVSFEGEASRDDPLYREIESIVDRIHREFDTDIGLFSTALAEFEDFMRGREIAGAELIEKSTRAVHDNEKREMARLVSVDETERRVAATDLPPAVAAMLRGPWARVLERVYLRDNGREQQFANALETADDLIWSVSPKLNADERRSLVTLLPSLLKHLQDGMDIAAVEQQDRGRFFAALVDCHAAAVKAGLRGESVRTLLVDTHPAAEVSPLFEKLFAEEKARELAHSRASRSGMARIQFTDHGIEVEEIALPEQSGNPVIADASSTSRPGQLDFNVTAAPVPELKRGTWVEFLHEGGRKIRAKLTWVSPLKGVYLFTNPGASEALSVAPDALQNQFQRGEARVIDASSIIDRAVDHMVQSLSHAMA
ncbi:MAG TPA: DUF1631 domain-containing protein [Usitatibacteraceae bacterium]